MSSTVILGNCQKNGSLGEPMNSITNLTFIYIFYHAHLFMVIVLSIMSPVLLKAPSGWQSSPHGLILSLQDCCWEPPLPSCWVASSVKPSGGLLSSIYLVSYYLPTPRFSYLRWLFWYLTVCTFLEEMSQDRKILVKQNVLI